MSALHAGTLASYAPDLGIDGGVILAPGFTPPIKASSTRLPATRPVRLQNMFVLLIAQSFAGNYPDLVDLDDILSPRIRRRQTACDPCGTDLADQVSDVPLEPTAEHATGHRTRQRFGRGDARHEQLECRSWSCRVWRTTIPSQFTLSRIMSQCALGSHRLVHCAARSTTAAPGFQARVGDPKVTDWMQARWEARGPSNCDNQLLGTTARATG